MEIKHKPVFVLTKVEFLKRIQKNFSKNIKTQMQVLKVQIKAKKKKQIKK